LQLSSLRIPSLQLPAFHGPWLPLAVAGSAWLVLLLSQVPAAPRGTPVAAWQPAAALLVIGLLTGAAIPPMRQRPLALSATLGLIVVAWGGILALFLAQRSSRTGWYAFPDSWALIGVGTAALGGGLVAARFMASALDRASPFRGRLLAGTAALCALAVALVPLAPAKPMLAPLAMPDLLGLLTSVPQRVYVLIKGAMIWVPLGFVLGAGGMGGALRRWVPAAVIAFFLVGWPLFGKLTASDLMQVLFAPVGVWLGLWLVERTLRTAGVEALRDAPPADSPRDQYPPAHTPPAFRLPAIARASPNALALAAAFLPIALAAWGLWDFPRFQLALGAALLLYLALLVGYRHAWLAVVPAVLPVLDLAPWTGRFFLDESDLFLLVTLGAALLHGRHREAGPFLSRPAAVLCGLFAATTLIALLIGLLPLAPLDANAFANYFSHYNALRVGKGFAWGLAFFLLLRWTVPRGSDLAARLFTIGLLLGLLGVILIGVRERWQFADLLDFSVPYRITASFSSMHTGGSHLPAFLILAVPFIWLWMVRTRNVAGVLAALALFAGALYLVVSTVTRAAFLALAVELALLSLFWVRGLAQAGMRKAASATAFAVTATIAVGLLYVGTQGYFGERMAAVQRDADTRLEHWRSALWMMDEGLGTSVFGMGLGRFPETYLNRNPAGRVPGNFRYASERGNGYLALGSGETLYLGQRVAVQPRTRYRLAMDLRGDARTLRLTVPLCEKHLLNSRRCNWGTYEAPGGDRQWRRTEVTLNSGEIGAGNLLSRPPVELYLYNAEEGRLVEVDNLSLRGPGGEELLRNGDFSRGGDFWLFRTHDHLAWHIKNLWVSLLFEQGWLGLLGFNLLMLAAFVHLARAAWRGRPVPAAALTAVTGFLALGLFSSPFDAPRLTALFFAVLAVALHAAPAAPAEGPQPGPRERSSRARGRPPARPEEPGGDRG
jgi:hypothetical protein